MKIRVKTYFDCTATDITGHFRATQEPFKDAAGQEIRDLDSWTRSRNQQRNWETINQLIALRAQPFDVTVPSSRNGLWSFEFFVENDLVYSGSGQRDDFSALMAECQSVPMILGLGESLTNSDKLICQGPDQNIWFEPINTGMETDRGHH
jgi:hypothetical protein